MIRLACAVTATALVAACATTSSPTRNTGSGVEIALSDGQNCHANKCFRYDAARNAVSIQGRVAVPAGNVGDYVSAATFNALHATALRARFKTSGRGG